VVVSQLADDCLGAVVELPHDNLSSVEVSSPDVNWMTSGSVLRSRMICPNLSPLLARSFDHHA